MMLIGRKKEVQVLEKIAHSSKAEFIVLYGRRRIGKTFLIREFFKQKTGLFFQATGLQNGTLKKQLNNFSDAMSQAFTHGISIQPPTSWDDCFKMLHHFINNINNDHQTVIFIDEVPWMATRKSGFLEALDYYWNHYWSSRSNFVLIVCGSSASWLIKNIIYNKGGLHNRCTCEIQLDPFDLEETSEYLMSKGITLNKRHTLELYMALGGVPYYLNYVEKGYSATENIQHVFFAKHAPLKDEFNKLFRSLFNESAAYIELIKLIAQKKDGLSRSEIETISKGAFTGGRLTDRLNDLKKTKFIDAYIPWNKQRGEYFKVIDEFCLFYLSWLFPKGHRPENYWCKQITQPAYQVWAGYAFEAICYKHIDKIIEKMGIKTVDSISSWRLISKKSDTHGAQIDLLIDRNDDAITLVEIKYTDKIFTIDKHYAEILQRKIDAFITATRTQKQIFLVIMSANGLKENQYSKDLITCALTLNDLF